MFQEDFLFEEAFVQQDKESGWLTHVFSLERFQLYSIIYILLFMCVLHFYLSSVTMILHQRVAKRLRALGVRSSLSWKMFIWEKHMTIARHRYLWAFHCSHSSKHPISPVSEYLHVYLSACSIECACKYACSIESALDHGGFLDCTTHSTSS